MKSQIAGALFAFVADLTSDDDIIASSETLLKRLAAFAEANHLPIDEVDNEWEKNSGSQLPVRTMDEHGDLHRVLFCSQVTIEPTADNGLPVSVMLGSHDVQARLMHYATYEQPKANLGMATNEQLVAELHTRWQLGHTALDYKAVDV